MEKLMANKLDVVELDMVVGGRAKGGSVGDSDDSPLSKLGRGINKVVTAPFKKGVELTSKLFDKIYEKVLPKQWG